MLLKRTITITITFTVPAQSLQLIHSKSDNITISIFYSEPPFLSESITQSYNNIFSNSTAPLSVIAKKAPALLFLAAQTSSSQIKIANMTSPQRQQSILTAAVFPSMLPSSSSSLAQRSAIFGHAREPLVYNYIVAPSARRDRSDRSQIVNPSRLEMMGRQ